MKIEILVTTFEAKAGERIEMIDIWADRQPEGAPVVSRWTANGVMVNGSAKHGPSARLDAIGKLLWRLHGG
jgi:hypothetical protein